MEQRQVDAGPPAVNGTTTGATLGINDCKLYVPVVTLSEDLIQQINLIGRLEEAANAFIIIEKKENTILEFSQNFANVVY